MWLAPLYVLFPFLLATCVRVVGFEAFESEGPSMEPTLVNGDRYLVDKTPFGLWVPFASSAATTWGSPERGDIVVLTSPHDEISVVKRVVAVAGDTIEFRDDLMWLNGSPVEREVLGECQSIAPGESSVRPGCVWARERLAGVEYVTSSDESSMPSEHPPLVVPEGQVYVLGDCRDRSNDSRFFGPVSVDRIRGRVLFLYWSAAADRIGTWVE